MVRLEKCPLGLCPEIHNGEAMPKALFKDCEYCGALFEAWQQRQRWCGDGCRDEYRNAELRAARRMFECAAADVKEELRKEAAQ